MTFELFMSKANVQKGTGGLTHDEVKTIAMLIGGQQPVDCSYCHGSRQERTITGVRTCRECGGTGFQSMSPELLRALLDMEKTNGG